MGLRNWREEQGFRLLKQRKVQHRLYLMPLSCKTTPASIRRQEIAIPRNGFRRSGSDLVTRSQLSVTKYTPRHSVSPQSFQRVPSISSRRGSRAEMSS